MTYLRKTLPSGRQVGLTHGEIVLPVRTLAGMSDSEIIEVVHELAEDYAILEDYLGGADLDDMTLEQAKAYVSQLAQHQRTVDMRTALVRRRRSEFAARRTQLTLALIERDGYICQQQGCDAQDDLTIDHIIPVSRGGTDEVSNLRLLCRMHNGAKSDRV